MNTENKLCHELLELTPEVLKNWDNPVKGDIFLVKRQIMLRCPLTNELVLERQCLQCKHNFGQSSRKWIYCLPQTEKVRGKRQKVKEKEK